jgi:hypothetical protein
MKDKFLPEDACIICDIMNARSEQPLKNQNPHSANREKTKDPPVFPATPGMQHPACVN